MNGRKHLCSSCSEPCNKEWNGWWYCVDCFLELAYGIIPPDAPVHFASGKARLPDADDESFGYQANAVRELEDGLHA